MNERGLAPIIKWSGSKRSLVPLLCQLWKKCPLKARARYLEPFVGGGAMLPARPCTSAVASDIVPELIALWCRIRECPAALLEHYTRLWNERQQRGAEVFYEARTRFNATRAPEDFLFLSRTCVNGLIRFNAKGEFNNSLHHTRPGIHPERLGQLLVLWSQAIREVDFLHADYRDTLLKAQAGDAVFLDPPYMGNRGRYGTIKLDFDAFFAVLETLNQRGTHWILTLDGHAGERSYQAREVPAELFKAHLHLPSGRSPFTRLMGSSLDMVNESVYANFKIP